MTAEKQTFPASRRAAYLADLANDGLIQEHATKQILTSMEAEEEAATKRRMKALTMVAKHRADRLVALARAEKHVKAFVQTVKEIIALAGDERAAMAELGESAETLTPLSITSRIARYWSHEIRQLVGPTAMRWGAVTLATYFRASVDWTAAEKRATAALTTPSKGEDYAS